MNYVLFNIYRILNDHFGALNWWPGNGSFEIAVGAILTQNTNWRNVESAVENLRNHNLLNPSSLMEAPDDRVAELIRPSGYYNIKTKRLKAFLAFLHGEYEGDMEIMFREDLWGLRKKLLSVKGIGQETADSILLYAGNKPVFVIDAYTRRILTRHAMIDETWSYRKIQDFFMDNLPHDYKIFNQYHACIVHTGKYFCKKNPLCDTCPLKALNSAAMSIQNGKSMFV